MSIHKKKALEIGDHESSDLSSSDESSSSSDLEEHEILQRSIKNSQTSSFKQERE